MLDQLLHLLLVFLIKIHQVLLSFATVQNEVENEMIILNRLSLFFLFDYLLEVAIDKDICSRCDPVKSIFRAKQSKK